MALHRFRLLRQPDLSHSTNAEPADEPIRPNDFRLPRSLGHRSCPWTFGQPICVGVSVEQRLDLRPQFCVLSPVVIDKPSPLEGLSLLPLPHDLLNLLPLLRRGHWL